MTVSTVAGETYRKTHRGLTSYFYAENACRRMGAVRFTGLLVKVGGDRGLHFDNDANFNSLNRFGLDPHCEAL